MPLLEDDLQGAISQPLTPPESFSGGASGFAGPPPSSGGGGSGAKLLDPPGLDKTKLLTDLKTDPRVLSALALQQQKVGAPPDMSKYKNQTPQWQNQYMQRARWLQSQLPQVPSSYIMKQLDDPYMNASDALAQTRSAWETTHPAHSHWWDHIIHNEVEHVIGGALNDAFIKAPQWLYQHTTVSLAYGLGELGGIDAHTAHTLSPGEIMMALGDKYLASERGGNMWDANGKLNDRSKWSSWVHLASGALDFTTRQLLDPTQLILNVALPGVGEFGALAENLGEGGALRALQSVGQTVHWSPLQGWRLGEEAAGVSRAVARFQGTTATAMKLLRESGQDTDRAFTYGRKLIDTGRAGAFYHALVRDIPTKEFAHILLNGSSRLRDVVDNSTSSWFNDVLKVAEDSRIKLDSYEFGQLVDNWRGKLLTRYSAVNSGGHNNGDGIFNFIQHNLMSSTRSGRTDVESLTKAANEGWASTLANTATPVSKQLLKDSMTRSARQHTVVENAIHTVMSRFGGGDVPATPTNLFPMIAGNGEVRSQLVHLVRALDASGQNLVDHFDSVGEVHPDNLMKAVETAAGRLASKSSSQRDALYEELQSSLGVPVVSSFKKVVQESSKQNLLDNGLKPMLRDMGASPDTLDEVHNSVYSVLDNMALHNGVTAFPVERVLQRPLNYLGTHTTNRIARYTNAVLTSMDWLPHSTINIEQPFYVQDLEKAGRLANLDEPTISKFVGLMSGAAGANGPIDETAMAGISHAYIRTIYSKFGLSDDEIDHVFESTSKKLNEDVFGALKDGTPITDPVLLTHNRNIAVLGNPNYLRSINKLVREARGQSPSQDFGKWLIRGIEDTTDSWMKMFKRLKTIMPRSGLRATLENAANAAAMGFHSPIGNPITFMLAMATAPFSPRLGMKVMDMMTPQHLRDVAVDVGDTGWMKGLYQAGLISHDAYSSKSIIHFARMADPLKQQAYRDTAANLVNKYLLNEPLFVHMATDGEQGAKDWLLSPAALDYRNTITKMRGETVYDPELGRIVGHKEMNWDQHFADVKDYANNLSALEPDVLHRMTTDGPGQLARINGEDLIGHEPAHIVASEWADYSGHHLNQVMDWLTSRNLGATENIARDYTFRRELNQEFWRRVGIADASSAKGLNHDVLMTLLNGGSVDAAKYSREIALYSGARQDTFQRLRSLFYDMSNHSRLSEGLRFVLPFGNVTQQVFARWGRTLAERPWVPHLGSTMLNAVEHSPWGYTDPNTNEQRIQFPLSHWLTKFAGLAFPNPLTGIKDIAYNWSGPLKGITMASNPIQGAGPVLDIPLRILSRYTPIAQNIYDFAYPYGDASAVSNYFPPGVKEGFELFNNIALHGSVGGDASKIDPSTEFGKFVTDSILEEYFGAVTRASHGDTTALSDFNRLENSHFRTIINRARIAFMISMFSNATLPVKMTEQSPLSDIRKFYQFVLSGTGDKNLADDALRHYLGMTNDPKGGRNIFNIDHINGLMGDNGSPWLKSSAFTALLAPETQVTGKFAGDSPGLFTKDWAKHMMNPSFANMANRLGTPFSSMMQEFDFSGFDRQSFEDAVRRGEMSWMTPTERLDKARSLVAQSYYFQFIDHRDQLMMNAGMPPGFTGKGSQPFKDATTQMQRDLHAIDPNFEAEVHTIDPTPKALHITALWAMATNPDFQSFDSMRGMKEYFDARIAVQQALSDAGLKSLKTKRSIDILNQWKSAIRDIASRHPWFQPLWVQFLQRDDPSKTLIGQGGIIDSSTLLDYNEQMNMFRLGLMG